MSRMGKRQIIIIFVRALVHLFSRALCGPVCVWIVKCDAWN